MGEGGFAGVQRHELFDGFGVGFLGLDSAGTDEGGAEIGIGQGGDGYAFAASGAVDERAAAEIDARMVAAPGMVEGDDVAAIMEPDLMGRPMTDCSRAVRGKVTPTFR